MVKNKKIIVVLPAYNAANTLTKTYPEIPFDIVDDVVLVAIELGITPIINHDKNKGYGRNQNMLPTVF